MEFKEWQPPVDQAELKEMFFLHEGDGYFTRLTDANSRRGMSTNDRCSMVTGTPTKAGGGLKMVVKGVPYPMHRLVWLYVYGEFPELNIGHIDGDKTNNAVDNLALIPKGKRNLESVYTDDKGEVDTHQLRTNLDNSKAAFKELGPAYRAAKKAMDKDRYRLTKAIEQASAKKATEVQKVVDDHMNKPEVSFL